MAVFNAERTFGVEIEVPTRRRAATLANTINAVFHNRGINQSCVVQSYNHTTQATWKIVPDQSVNGWEVVSPPMRGLQGKAELEAVCHALTSLDIRVDRTVGLHVHHDAADLSGQAIGSIFATYAAHQELINMLLAPSRRNNWFCRTINYANITNNGEWNYKNEDRYEAVRKIQRGTGTRYVSLNIESIFNHGTIEFRQHQGTIDAEKIWNWVLVTQSIIEAGAEIKRLPKPTSGKDSKRSPFSLFRRVMRISPTDNGNNMNADIYMEAYRYFAKRLMHFCQTEGIDPETLQAAEGRTMEQRMVGLDGGTVRNTRRVGAGR